MKIWVSDRNEKDKIIDLHWIGKIISLMIDEVNPLLFKCEEWFIETVNQGEKTTQ